MDDLATANDLRILAEQEGRELLVMVEWERAQCRAVSMRKHPSAVEWFGP